MTTRIDRDGLPVPNDLVLLPDHNDLAASEVITVMRATWYQIGYAPNHFCIAASFAELRGLSEDSIEDAGMNIDACTITRIDAVLRRYSPEDGFYHA